MGYTISAAGMATFISGCKQDGSVVETTAWSPSFMSKDECSLVENILEAMLPASESSPGYKDVGAIQILDNTVAKLYSSEDNGRFKKGLGLLQQKFSEHDNMTSFMDKYMGHRDDNEQTRIDALLSSDIEKLDEAGQSEYGIYSMVSALRDLGISSYFSSETIGTEYLNYDPVPGQWNGCADLSISGGKAWTQL